MAKKSLQELKAFYASEDKPQNGGTSNFGKYYPFWNMQSGQSVKIRFLPDLNEDNPHGFLVEQIFHNLTINGKKEKVSCLSMYGEDCPICKLSQDYYKAKDEKNGKRYWRKKQYLAQAIIVDDPLPADKDTNETHQGKVRYFALGFQIHNVIKDAFASEDDPLESIPYEFKDGYDFIIKKTEKGMDPVSGKPYPDYSVGTKFMSKQRSLNDQEVAEAADNMVDLSTLLPKNPGRDKVEAMLNADINGGTMEDVNGSNSEDDVPFDQASPAKTATPAPAPAPKAEPAAESADSDVDDMLATIRKRRAAAAAGA